MSPLYLHLYVTPYITPYIPPLLSDGSDHNGIMMVIAITGLFIYPMGIPLTYFVTVYRLRHLINQPDRDNSDPRISYCKFLFETYKPRTYWFEAADSIRRLLLAGE